MIGTAYEQRIEPAATLSGEFTTLLRDLTRAERGASVPGLDWNVAEVAAHVLSVYRRYTGDMRRARTVAELSTQNAHDVADIGTDIDAIADELDAQMESIAAVAPTIPLDTTFPFHAGVTVTANAAWANLIGELLVHGDDIARATGRRWTVADTELEGIWRVLVPAASGWLRPEARTIDERYELHFAFGAVAIRIAGGDVLVDTEPAGTGRATVITATDVATTTLAFPYRRRLITDPALALLASRFYDI
jgi:hypothetical protein